ncbi:RDD family protein [Algimonas porphyrae]|uniref:RDD domain-containing protein n=2 Tax=Algimonas porphyrae TaxID=1128113 RepID=A0ABQ5UZ95_9PROT|nr:hypothetical protein GCM10007854_08380 [Algimonas porphyrae]
MGLRRIAAYLVDYIVILLWLGLIFSAAMLGLIGINDPDVWTGADRWIAQAQAFLMVTLPVYLYFTISESRGRKATPGKRLLGLTVDGTPLQIMQRNLVKFLPWEVAHTAIWHGMPLPAASEPTPLGLTLMCLSMAAAGLYIISLFIGSGRTPYDRISGTQVVRAT